MPWPPLPKQRPQGGACFGRRAIRPSGIPQLTMTMGISRASDEVAVHHPVTRPRRFSSTGRPKDGPVGVVKTD
jgi:hypothetical protein